CQQQNRSDYLHRMRNQTGAALRWRASTQALPKPSYTARGNGTPGRQNDSSNKNHRTSSDRRHTDLRTTAQSSGYRGGSKTRYDRTRSRCECPPAASGGLAGFELPGARLRSSVAMLSREPFRPAPPTRGSPPESTVRVTQPRWVKNWDPKPKSLR